MDPLQVKEQQRRDWDAVAAGWKRWWATLEQGAQRVSHRLLELAAVQPGHRVLDVATGIGEPAITAARRVGPEGRVIATDQAPQMLAVARERAAAMDLRNIAFREMDGERLELPENHFHAVLCRWGLMFFPRYAAALERMRQLLVPGGRLAAAVWADPPKVPLIGLAMGVVREVLRVPPPPAEAPGPFRLADAEALARTFLGAGFTEVRVERLTVTFEFPSAEAYARFQQDVAAPIAALLSQHPPERRAAVWQAVARAAHQRFAAADGRLRMPNETLCVVGRRAP